MSKPEIILVYTTPDGLQLRGLTLTPIPTKRFSECTLVICSAPKPR